MNGKPVPKRNEPGTQTAHSSWEHGSACPARRCLKIEIASVGRGRRVASAEGFATPLMDRSPKVPTALHATLTDLQLFRAWKDHGTC